MLSRYLVSQVKHNSYFVAGVALGLWVALATVPLEDGLEACESAGAAGTLASNIANDDEYSPAHVVRPAPAGGHAVTRPRYYSTELGMRAPLLAAILSTEDQLDGRVVALNATLSPLGGALRFFMAASSRAAPAPRPNVVGFTDSREMLRPFHALKYLADNYLEDYELFFLGTDVTWVNARRLQAIAGSLSAARVLYLGTPALGSPYCDLDAGLILSRAALAAVQGSLDWCVRNSYSPHHHENIGRCVMHAAHVQCTSHLQGVELESVDVSPSLEGALRPSLADALTAHPIHHPTDFYRLHAYVSRVYLERDQAEMRRLGSAVRRLSLRHPPGYRNLTWPPGLRNDPGLPPLTPNSRFDHWRWVWFNSSHALTAHDHSAATKLSGVYREAVDLVIKTASAWLSSKSGVAASFLSGAWHWHPPTALTYRLLFSLTHQDGATSLRGVEVCRPVGGARLVAVPYVTESARVTILQPITARLAGDVTAFLRTYQENWLKRHHNTHIVVVSLVSEGESESEAVSEARGIVQTLSRQGAASWARGTMGGGVQNHSTEEAYLSAAQHAALGAASAVGLLSRDTLVLLVHPAAEFNDDFLNRVRMNTILGVSWYLPAAFHRWAQFAHPQFVDAAGNKPTTGTGRFARHYHTVSFYKRDYDEAAASWSSSNLLPPESVSVPSVLVQWGLRCVSGAEPALVVKPQPPPCGLLSSTGADSRCLKAHRDADFRELELGSRAGLAGLVIRTDIDSDTDSAGRQHPHPAPAPAHAA